jgi:hypothetical protein
VLEVLTRIEGAKLYFSWSHHAPITVDIHLTEPAVNGAVGPIENSPSNARSLKIRIG